MNTKIKYYRQLKGWSQERLSKEAKVSRPIISGLENGTINVTTNITMTRLSKALNVGIAELFL